MTRARARHIILAVAVSLLLAALPWAPIRAEDGRGRLLLDATPLVLKDGRMAYVSIHTVPFAPGADTLAPPAAAALAALAADLATDCFLTAQAIGHVEPGAKGEGDDTLATHRLARTRADRVQRLLGEKGLPATAIASVWDYQFLVREPRVTLWVFKLREGEDCRGEPLPAGKSPVVAAAERKAAAARKGQPQPVPAAGPSPFPAPAIREVAASEARAEGEVRAAAVPPLPTTAAAAGPPLRDGRRDEIDQRAALAAAPAPSTRPRKNGAEPVQQRPAAPASVAAPAQAGAPAAVQPPPPTAVAAISGGKGREATGAAAVVRATEDAPSPIAAGAAATNDERPPVPRPPPRAVAALGRPAASAGTAEIVFDKNSSFLPSGAGRELERLVAGLPKAKGYEVELAATVGGADAKARNSAEAARYDRWLAERRLARVAEWLEKHAQIRELSLKRGLVENDPSRRVAIRVHPLP